MERPATDQLAAMVALLSQSGSKTAMSEAPGTVGASPPPSLQPAGFVVDQSLALVPTLSPLPPTQYLVAAKAPDGRRKKNNSKNRMTPVLAPRSLGEVGYLVAACVVEGIMRMARANTPKRNVAESLSRDRYMQALYRKWERLAHE